MIDKLENLLGFSIATQRLSEGDPDPDFHRRSYFS
jgi:hypothetical protein